MTNPQSPGSLLAAHALAPLTAAASPVTFDQIFRPLEYLDLGRLYEHYSVLIDLVLFSIIFIGVTQVSLGSRFPGRGGKAICAGIGLALAISLVAAEKQFQFTLESFGPMAAGIIVLLLGIMIYRLLLHAGMAKNSAIAAAYVSIFLLMHAVAQGFIRWLQRQMPFAYIIALAALLISIYIAASSLWPSHLKQELFQARLRQIRENDPQRKQQRELVEREGSFLKRILRPNAKKARREEREIQDDLRSIADAIRRYGSDPKARGLIIDRMGKVIPKSKALLERVHDLRARNEQLKRFDINHFSENSRSAFAQMSDEEKSIIRKQMQDELEKIGLEKHAGAIEEHLEEIIPEVARLIQRSAAHLQQGEVAEAGNRIREALATETKVSDLAKQVRTLEDSLLRLTKKEIGLQRE